MSHLMKKPLRGHKKKKKGGGGREKGTPQNDLIVEEERGEPKRSMSLRYGAAGGKVRTAAVGESRGPETGKTCEFK